DGDTVPAAFRYVVTFTTIRNPWITCAHAFPGSQCGRDSAVIAVCPAPTARYVCTVTPEAAVAPGGAIGARTCGSGGRTCHGSDPDGACNESAIVSPTWIWMVAPLSASVIVRTTTGADGAGAVAEAGVAGAATLVAATEGGGTCAGGGDAT